MEPDDLTVDPGSQVTTKVTVRNLGTRVEEFELLVQGPGASFATVMPATVSVYPDVEQRAVVRFAPVRGPQSPAGVNTFEVVARSVVHADVRDVARGRLTVTAFEDLQAVLKPDASRGRRPARHLVSVTNGGNTSMSSQVTFTDQDRVLTFDPPGTPVSLQPGGTVDVPVLLNGPRRWFGRTERLPFAAVVSPTGAQPPITLNGVRQQTAVFPWWAPPAALAAVAVAIAVMALLIPWLNRTPTVPVIGAVDQTAAVQQLTKADYVPEPIIRGDDTVPKGMTISTDPAGGTPLKRGERVKLFISSGECAQGPCPVEVPSVEGLPVSEAQAKLEEKKFTVRIDRVPSEDRAVDRVVSSEPAATTMRPPGTDVRLTVSTGPPENPAEQAAADKAAADKAAADKVAAEQKKAEEAQKKAEEAQKKAEEAQKRAEEEQKKGPPPVPVPVPPTLVAVPDLTAQSPEDATKALTDLGLKAKTEPKAVHSNAVPDGQVLSTKPAKDDKVAPGSEVKLTVAKNTVPADLIAAAEDASWANESGTTLTFPGTAPGETGLVRTTTVNRSTVLETTPAPGNSIIGTYTLSQAQAVVPGDHLRVQIGLLDDESTPDTPVNLDAREVRVVVKAGNVTKTETINSSAPQKTIDVDLSKAVGATKINITVEDTRKNPGTTPQRVGWQKLLLEPKVG